MKRLIWSILLFAIIIGTSFCGKATVCADCDRLIKAIDDCTKKDSEQNAAEVLSKIWKNRENRLSVFADLDEVRDIGISVDTVVALSEYPNETDYTVSLKETKSKIKKLKENNQLSILSIF